MGFPATVAVQVNQTLVMTYWQIGRKLETEVLQRDSHRYGEATMTRLAERLTQEFGRGFGYPNLYRMVKFFLKFPDPEILSTLSTKFSWSHFLEFIKIEDPLKRDFYVQVCSSQAWSVRQLHKEMNSLLFERTMLSKQPEGVIRQELANLETNPAELSPRLFLKDPYLLDFLDLKDHFSEKDLENAILHELERFILELGSDFAFIGRQRRIQVGGSDFYIDLLFYHRKLKRLVVVELKLGEFRPEHKGQVELYLKWLARHDVQPDEKPPIAIILCTTRDAEIVELLDLEKDHIHIAEYWLELPPREVLQARLHEAMVSARVRLERT
ncbi:MAG: cytoplasmic protein [Deltaproteobacteria bacterium HGW-Deltaproteobacteria-17]|nr:MAG: cytoplasmic protein [Deltaproteobacteria bacterium HGW-Deltaproteobacteria-17]